MRVSLPVEAGTTAAVLNAPEESTNAWNGVVG